MKKTFYQLPPEQCERLRAQEMAALRWSIAAVNICSTAEGDLKDRLECIPNGRVRFRLMLGQLRAICNDLIGTTTIKQAKQIRNVMNDMELRMVPKFSASTSRMVLDKEQATFLVEAAKEAKCAACILDGEECRRCELYQLLEAVTPLDNWSGTGLCPYNHDDWKER